MTPGGLTRLAKQVIKTFFNPDPNSWCMSRTGLWIPCPGGVDRRRLRFDFSCFICDEKALKGVFNVMGSAGVKPCLLCRNVIYRCDAHSAYFKTCLLYTSPSPRDRSLS
eukprot:4101822-Pyramimonas_sp.AAC.1